jgi:hypothetical protein
MSRVRQHLDEVNQGILNSGYEGHAKGSRYGRFGSQRGGRPEDKPGVWPKNAVVELRGEAGHSRLVFDDVDAFVIERPKKPPAKPAKKGK